VQLWSPSSPALYSASATVALSDGASSDQLSTSFGIRSFSFNSTHGLVLNGEPVLLYGGCVHHANGPMGSKTVGRSEERRVQLLKQQGYNSIRTRHNPVSEAFLDACDRARRGGDGRGVRLLVHTY